jgi:Uncharacterized conserved protein
MDNKKISEIIDLICREVKPALGCTEPMAVSLAVSKSCEILKEINIAPDSVEVQVSGNILKNGMGVGIPGTDMVGLYIASALGVTCGRSEYKLEVLKDINTKAIDDAKALVDEGKIKITLATDPAKLYIKAIVSGSNHNAETIIKDNHDSIIYTALDGKSILGNGNIDADNICIDNKYSDNKSHDNVNKEKIVEHNLAREITVKEIYEFATTVPFEKIEFILESEKLNKALSREGLKNNYGLRVGKTIASLQHNNVFGNSILSYAMAATSAASDARMAGCTLPAMSNSGSGNQGITVTMPVIAVAEKMDVSREALARALTISHLVAIHIKGYLGKLSALCGCVIASTGSSCGIVYLKGGSYEQICYAIKNMIGNITGMVCDGAKVGCALKVASGVSSSIQSAVLALDNICISSKEGIIEDDIEKTIANLGEIGSDGMSITDKMILDIMVAK